MRSRKSEISRPCIYCTAPTQMIRDVGSAPPVRICRPYWNDLVYGELPKERKLGMKRARYERANG